MKVFTFASAAGLYPLGGHRWPAAERTIHPGKRETEPMRQRAARGCRLPWHGGDPASAQHWRSRLRVASPFDAALPESEPGPVFESPGCAMVRFNEWDRPWGRTGRFDETLSVVAGLGLAPLHGGACPCRRRSWRAGHKHERRRSEEHTSEL